MPILKIMDKFVSRTKTIITVKNIHDFEILLLLDSGHRFFYFDRFGPENFRAARDGLLEAGQCARAAAPNMAF